MSHSVLKTITTFYQKHSDTIQATIAFLTLLGATNYIPKNWWTSPLLSWNISSQTTITLIIVLLYPCLFVYLKNLELEKKIASLTLKKLSSPEERAEEIKKRVTYGSKVLSKLFGEKSENNGKQKDTV